MILWCTSLLVTMIEHCSRNTRNISSVRVFLLKNQVLQMLHCCLYRTIFWNCKFANDLSETLAWWRNYFKDWTSSELLSDERSVSKIVDYIKTAVSALVSWCGRWTWSVPRLALLPLMPCNESTLFMCAASTFCCIVETSPGKSGSHVKRT